MQQSGLASIGPCADKVDSGSDNDGRNLNMVPEQGSKLCDLIIMREGFLGNQMGFLTCRDLKEEWPFAERCYLVPWTLYGTACARNLNTISLDFNGPVISAMQLLKIGFEDRPIFFSQVRIVASLVENATGNNQNSKGKRTQTLDYCALRHWPGIQPIECLKSNQEADYRKQTGEDDPTI